MAIIHQHELSDRSLAYCWSHGPVDSPIVVLHGLGDSAIHTYAPRFASTTLRDTPSLFIDLPGFGEGSAPTSGRVTIESMAADVHSLLEHLALQQSVVFGHSMGGNIAIALLHRHPEIASRLIMAEPLLNPADSILAVSIAKQSRSSFLDRRHAMLIRATRIQVQRGDRAAAAFLPTLLMADPATLYAAAESLIAPRGPDFLEMLAHIPCPKDLLVGERTPVDLGAVKGLDVRIHIIPNAGHAMMVEQSAGTAYAMLGIVSR